MASETDPRMEQARNNGSFALSKLMQSNQWCATAEELTIFVADLYWLLGFEEPEAKAADATDGPPAPLTNVAGQEQP